LTTISSLVPNVDDLLTLEVEDLAGVLLTHLNTHPGHQLSERISYSQFFENLLTGPPFGCMEYGTRQREANGALMEAWSWLEREGLLIKDGETPNDFYFISRRGKRLKAREDLDAYRKANILPKAQLHPLIARVVYPAFLRGDYDTAIFEAYKEVEVAVRTAGSFSHDDYGEPLMRDAFAPADKNRPAGPLADVTLPSGEQMAMSHLFAGAFGVYRNSTGHRRVGVDAVDAAEVIVLASQLLRTVDRLKQRRASIAA
jgi:uncharacterized protein (TIGR02391 family)